MEKLRSRARFVNCLLIFNLAASALGAAGVGLMPGRSVPWMAFRAYGVLSGASDRYSFFAPNVRTQGRIRFQIATGAGPDTVVGFEADGSRDTKLRLSVMTLGLFPSVLRSAGPGLGGGRVPPPFRGRPGRRLRGRLHRSDHGAISPPARAGLDAAVSRATFTRDRRGIDSGDPSNTVRVGPGLPST